MWTSEPNPISLSIEASGWGQKHSTWPSRYFNWKKKRSRTQALLNPTDHLMHGWEFEYKITGRSFRVRWQLTRLTGISKMGSEISSSNAWLMKTTTASPWKFAAWLSELKPGLCDTLEGCDGMGRERETQREGTYVYLWLIHVDVWQKPTQYCNYPSTENK